MPVVGPVEGGGRVGRRATLVVGLVAFDGHELPFLVGQGRGNGGGFKSGRGNGLIALAPEPEFPLAHAVGREDGMGVRIHQTRRHQRPARVALLGAGGNLLVADNDFGYFLNADPLYTTYFESTYVSDSGSDGVLTGQDIMAGINPDISADPYPDDFTIAGTNGVVIFDAPSTNAAGPPPMSCDVAVIGGGVIRCEDIYPAMECATCMIAPKQSDVIENRKFETGRMPTPCPRWRVKSSSKMSASITIPMPPSPKSRPRSPVNAASFRPKQKTR